MGIRNQSTVTEFLILGLTEQSELRLPLFFLFLGIYTVTVVGNLGMILLIGLSPQLHIPMYYFLSSLSFLDFCYSSDINSHNADRVFKQRESNLLFWMHDSVFFICMCAVCECYMLAAMAYDRYVAICSPLLYNVIMSPRVCSLMVAALFSVGFTLSIIYEVFLVRMEFCGSNILKHYCCDIIPLMKLSCSSTYIEELLIFVIGGFNAVTTSMTIIISYVFILSSILRIQSREGRSKAFSTCGSHLTAVLIFYGSLMSMYLKPASSSSAIQEKVTSIFYTVVIPMLNPLVYSLRNKEVKNALMKLLKRKISSN